MSTHIYYLSFPFNEQISIEPLTDFNSRLFIVAEVYEPWGILKLSKLLSTLVSKGCFESPSLSHWQRLGATNINNISKLCKRRICQETRQAEVSSRCYYIITRRPKALWRTLFCFIMILCQKKKKSCSIRADIHPHI